MNIDDVAALGYMTQVHQLLVDTFQTTLSRTMCALGRPTACSEAVSESEEELDEDDEDDDEDEDEEDTSLTWSLSVDDLATNTSSSGVNASTSSCFPVYNLNVSCHVYAVC